MQKQTKGLNFGEVLYPAFNKLIPKLVEGLFVSRFIADTHKNIQCLMSLTWNCLSFAFNSQILQKVVSKAIKDTTERGGLKDVQMFDNRFNRFVEDEDCIKRQPHNMDDSKLTEYKRYSPLELEFSNPKTTLFKRKLKELHSKVKVKGIIERAKGDRIQLPVYNLFKDSAVHEALIESIMDIIIPKPVPTDDKENDQKAENENTQKLRSSSKLKRSQLKNSQKDDLKQALERTDKVTLRMKMLGFCLINSLGTTTSSIHKVLYIIHTLIDEEDNLEEV